MLYPIESKSRSLSFLDGSWDFVKGGKNLDLDIIKNEFHDARPMPVPSSYNDIYKDLREHFGWVYYRKEFYFHKTREDERIFLRFDGVNQSAKVYLNGEFLTEHEGGFLPFEIEISDDIQEENVLTLAVSNVINNSTLPVGIIKGREEDQDKNEPNFDFFNYAGIHRHVRIYTTPRSYIEDISLTNEIYDAKAVINYDLEVQGVEEDILIEVFDKDNKLVASGNKAKASLVIKNPNLWDVKNPYLYKIKITYKEDTYYLEYGIRSVEVKGNQFLLNGKPFYFKGFGKHEDSILNGRGFNEVISHKDFALMKEMGANSFRTAHYPYAEETLRLADKLGFLVIDETTAVGLNGKFGGGANFKSDDINIFDNEEGMAKRVFDHHKDVIRDLIARDKNYACVVMWSIANEPDSYSEGAYDYFKPLFDLAKKEDPQKRPTCLISVLAGDINLDVTRKLSDVICLNRYYGWYNDGPYLDKAMAAFRKELDNWKELGKPIIISEYGADAILGMRDYDVFPAMFSEDFQVLYYRENNKVIDQYPSVVGEHPWNFADFNTAQSIKRVNGNKKGLFSRDRQPKLAVGLFKERWTKMDDYRDKNKK